MTKCYKCDKEAVGFIETANPLHTVKLRLYYCAEHFNEASKKFEAR
jgi:hypothetical protein